MNPKLRNDQYPENYCDAQSLDKLREKITGYIFSSPLCATSIKYKT